MWDILEDMVVLGAMLEIEPRGPSRKREGEGERDSR